MLTLLLILAMPPQAPPLPKPPPVAPPLKDISPAAKPVKTPTIVKKPVAPAEPFKNGSKHLGHNCPVCGKETKTVFAGVPDVPGHTHRCHDLKCRASDGNRTVWFH